MTRFPEIVPSTRRRLLRVGVRAALALAWIVWSLLASGPIPPVNAGGTAPAAEVWTAQAPSQTPEDPEPGDGDDGFDDEGEDGEEGGVTPSPVKPEPVAPDSLKRLPAATLPSGSAPMETLGVTKPAIGVPRAASSTPPPSAPPKQRQTLFGIHPAAFFALLVVGHVFVVRAVTD